jgi:uncharacterized protein
VPVTYSRNTFPHVLPLPSRATRLAARLERVVLCGSPARGDVREDSDYNVAVFLRDYVPHTTTELYRLADLSTAILADGGGFIHAMPYPAGPYDDPRIPLMYTIRAEGIDLSRESAR